MRFKIGGTDEPECSCEQINNWPSCLRLVLRFIWAIDSYRSASQSQLDGLCVEQRDPALGNQTLLRHVQVEQVESVIDGLDLADLDEPIFEFLRRGDEHAMTMILSLTENGVQIFNASHDAHRHLATIGRCLWTWIQCRTETLADLLDAGLQLVALEEDDEHRFVDVVTLCERKAKD